ncbi:MAG: hypothetical protein ACYDGR_17145 [Candidatus Dormibacteria bacterium]
MPRGLDSIAVLLRRPGAPALQGLRTAVSLSLGDRPVTLLIMAEAVAVLAAEPGTEMADNLEALRAGGVSVVVAGDEIEGADPIGRQEVLREFARHPLRQVF